MKRKLNELNKLHPNSYGCEHGAHKIGNVSFDERIDMTDQLIQVAITHDFNDDFNEDGTPKQGRLVVLVELYNEDKNWCLMGEFDLELFLKEAKILCPHLF